MQLSLFLLVMILLPLINGDSYYYLLDLQTPLVCDSEELHQQGQTINILGRNIFTQCDELISLNLTQNEIKHIEDNAFQNLPNLTHIDLSSNMIMSLSTGIFSNTEKLEDLYFTKNRITSLKRNLFANLTYLKSVDFQYNSITHIEEDCFVNVPSLMEINLGNNSLKTLQFNIIDDISSLAKIHLAGNPWNCGPDLCEFMQTVVTRFWHESSMPVCQSPNGTEGATFKEVIQTPLPAIAINGTVTNIFRRTTDPVVLKCHICSNSSLTWKNPALRYENELNKPRQTSGKYYTLSTQTIYNFSVLDIGFYTCYVGSCITCKSRSTIYLPTYLRKYLNVSKSNGNEVTPEYTIVTLPTFELPKFDPPKVPDNFGRNVGLSVSGVIILVVGLCLKFCRIIALVAECAESSAESEPTVERSGEVQVQQPATRLTVLEGSG